MHPEQVWMVAKVIADNMFSHEYVNGPSCLQNVLKSCATRTYEMAQASLELISFE